jgi:hypothetical protein
MHGAALDQVVWLVLLSLQLLTRQSITTSGSHRLQPVSTGLMDVGLFMTVLAMTGSTNMSAHILFTDTLSSVLVRNRYIQTTTDGHENLIGCAIPGATISSRHHNAWWWVTAPCNQSDLRRTALGASSD